MQVVSQVDSNEHSGGGGVDAHVVRGVVQELGSGISLYVVRVVVAPSELDVNPVFLCGGAVHHIPAEEGQRSDLVAGREGSRSTFIKIILPKTYFESASRDGRETFHLYDANRRMSAQEEFIL